MTFLPLWQQVCVVAAGGAVGAVLRFATGFMPGLSSGGIATLAVNIFGCFVLACVVELATFTGTLSLAAKLFFITGVLGAFTTFSAFSLHTVLLFQKGEAVQAAFYVLASVVGSLCAFVAGVWLVRAFLSH